MTLDRLAALEQEFGGVHHVARKRVSPHAIEPKHPNMRGGDRMGVHCHGYAAVYAEYLREFVDQAELVVVEVGILKGTGLAIWSKVFPDADLIGLDIDLRNFDLPFLQERGAFKRKLPELHEVDQFTVTADDLASVLKGRKVSISFDDGFHTLEAAQRTLQSLQPHFAECFAHFIEDMPGIAADIRKAFPEYSVTAFGALTVVRPHDAA